MILALEMCLWASTSGSAVLVQVPSVLLFLEAGVGGMGVRGDGSSPYAPDAAALVPAPVLR